SHATRIVGFRRLARHLARLSRLSSFVAVMMTVTLLQPADVYMADRTDIATSALEFGGSVGEILLVADVANSRVSQADANQYVQLAARIKEQIQLGRASSGLVSANFNVIGTTLAYSAAVDPEPLSHTVALVAAWGAKKTGDALSQAVIEQ